MNMGPFHPSQIVLSVLLAFIAGVLTWRYYCWARRRLEAWARDHQVRVLRQEWRLFLRGPYDGLGKYVVFKIRAADASGVERTGWVRLGGFWSGLWSGESHVVWEREPQPPSEESAPRP